MRNLLRCSPALRRTAPSVSTRLAQIAFPFVVGAAVLGAANRGSSQDRSPAADEEFFEQTVRPILVERCQRCHGRDGQAEGGLRLTSRAAILAGGESGPAAVPGKPAESTLLRAINYESELRMPPDRKLPQREIEALARWVARGLAWPAADSTRDPAPTVYERRAISDEQRRFWSFQPLSKVALPSVQTPENAPTELDRFLLARLEAAGLAPVGPASKRELLRRATFDLIGLPPTPAEIDEFMQDESPGAFAKVVDRLLESPHYGERWGRHWLDVVRYADSVDARQIGQPGDINEAYRYRDWVVDALQRDLPYDQFVADQIAGDLLHADSPERFAAGLTATSMLAIGRWEQGEADKEKMVTDIVDDQIDVISRGFLGLTLACARCHDHKFDPFGSDDYYALAGMFFSSSILPDPGAKAGDSQRLRLPLLSPSQTAERDRRLARADELEKSIAATLELRRGALQKQLFDRLEHYLLAAHDVARNEPGKVDAPRPPESIPADSVESVLVNRLVAWLGLSDATQPHVAGLLTTKLTVINPQSGIVGWGSDATPWIAGNPSDAAARAGTLTVPPRSIALHPAPDRPAGIAWRSPAAHVITITGVIADGDASCGNGVEWTVERWRGGVRETLAEGRIANGGRQDLPAESLRQIRVETNDVLALLVRPNAGDHACDTTVVELKLRAETGERDWNLARDVVDSIQESNPLRDRYGQRDVWYFFALRATSAGPPPESSLAKWTLWRRQESTRSEFEKRTAEFAREIRAAPADTQSPDGKVRLAMIDPTGPIWSGLDLTGGLDEASRESLAATRRELDELRRDLARPLPVVHGIREGGVPQTAQVGIHDVAIHIRGRYDRLGAVVPRRLPRLFAGDQQAAIERESGRRQLAAWIASPENPLTARVFVNRLWLHHFGEGLVRTPGNFGKLGQPPTHPELLDWLARRFIEQGWSIKAMHRLIMGSAAYQRSSRATPELVARDPDNRLLGRMHRRRLDAESIRDALLSVSGQLDPVRGGPPIRDLNAPRRTLYIMTVRSDRSTFRDLFDAADPTALVDQRNASTVAPQALFMLNHPFALEQASQLARRSAEWGPSDRARLERLYVVLFGRPPNEREIEAGVELLADARRESPDTAWDAYCQVLLCSNEFLYVD